MCNTIYGDDIVTPTRCHHKSNVLNVVDNLTDTNFHPLLSNKITHAASKHHKKSLFIQPTSETCPIYLLLYPITTCSTVLKVCCGNYLCKGCMWKFIERARRVTELECSFCRIIPYKDNNEYVQWLEEKQTTKKLMARQG